MRIASASKIVDPEPGRSAPRSSSQEAPPPAPTDAFEKKGALRRALGVVRPFARGAVHGAVHPFQVVQREKLKAGAGLAGLAAATAGMHLAGLPDPTLAIVAGGGLVVGYDAWQVGRTVKRLPPGEERTAGAGAVASKFGLWALTSTIAHFISPHEAHVVAEHVVQAGGVVEAAKGAALAAAAGLTAGADAVLFGLDAADHKKHADAADRAEHAPPAAPVEEPRRSLFALRLRRAR